MLFVGLAFGKQEEKCVNLLRLCNAADDNGHILLTDEDARLLRMEVGR